MNRHSGVSHSSSHAHSFEYTTWIRGRTNRSRSSQSVVLTVSSLFQHHQNRDASQPLENLFLLLFQTTSTNSPSSKISALKTSPDFTSAANPSTSIILTGVANLGFLGMTQFGFGCAMLRFFLRSQFAQRCNHLLPQSSLVQQYKVQPQGWCKDGSFLAHHIRWSSQLFFPINPGMILSFL